jgi:uncharacterized protein (DUF3084 family)
VEEQNQKSSKLATGILAVCLMGSLGLNYYQFNKGQNTMANYETKVDTLEMARTEVEAELNATYAELEKFKGQNAQMDSILNEANVRIDEQKSKIGTLLKSVKNSEELNKKLTAELDELRKLKDAYLDKIDSLMLANQQLMADNTQLNTKVQDLDNNLKSTVNKASMLQAEYIKAVAFKKRSSTKYTETAMAKRTNKIEVSFKLIQNRIAKSGQRTVYLRIVEPGGEVIGNKATGSKVVKINGSDVLFSNSTQVDYTNDNKDVVIAWEEADRNFTAGTYNIEIYVDDYLAGANTIVLK